MLSLAEEILLLSLLEKKESIQLPSSLSLPFALSASVIYEMIQAGQLVLEDGRLSATLLSEQASGEVGRVLIEKLAQTEKPKKLRHWVFVLGARGKRIIKITFHALVERGLLVEDKKGFIWSGLDEGGLQQDQQAKYLLKRQMRDALYCDATVSEHTLICLVLMEACGLFDHLFTKDELVAARKKMRQIKTEDHYPAQFLTLLDQIVESLSFAVASAVSG
jgi:hypothetical protein